MSENNKTYLNINIQKTFKRIGMLLNIAVFSAVVFIVLVVSLTLNATAMLHAANELDLLRRILFEAGITLPVILLVYVFFVSIFIYNDYKVQYAMLKRQKEAEEMSYKFIRSNLPEDFLIFRNVSLGYGDIDLIIVGSKGIFVVEVKSNRGAISLDTDGYIRVKDGDVVSKQYRRQVISESNRLKRYLDNELNAKNFVQPVLLFPFAVVMKDMYLTNRNDRYKVPILGLNRVTEYIYAQNNVIPSQEKMSDIRKAIEKAIEGGVEFDKPE